MSDKTSSPEPTAGAASPAGRRAMAQAERFAGWLLLAPGELVQWARGLDRKSLAWGSLALAAIMFMALNFAMSLAGRNVAADLTQERLYTLSNGTRKVLARVQDPIDVRVYYSHRLGVVAPTFQRSFERVKGLLEQYRDISKGKVQVSFVDPEPFSEAEERASAAGLRGTPLNQDGETAYFGLVASNQTDNDATIPFFSPDRERFLEYDLTKLVSGLSNPKKKVVGLISGVPIDGGMNPMNPRGQPAPAWLVMDQIREFFDVRTLEPNLKEVPKDIDVLMLVQPSMLAKDAAYAVDQFALAGGHVLAFVDPVTEASPDMTGMGGLPVSPDFRNILVHWGLSFDPDKIVGDPKLARRVQYQSGGSREKTVTDYLSWLQLDKAQINDKDPLAASIKRLNLASAGALTKVDGATTIIQPLLETSADAGLLDAMLVRFRPDPLAMRRAFKSGGSKLMLAARIGGEAKTAFPDGRPKEEKKPEAAEAKPGEPKPADAKPAEATPTDAKPADPAKAAPAKAVEVDKSHIAAGRVNVVVVADSDLLADSFWIEVQNMLGQQVAVPVADNAGFVVNALENLSSGEALADLRGRGIVDRPFDRVVDIRRRAEMQYRQKEEALVTRLQDLQQKLAQVRTKGDEATSQQLILSDAEKREIEKFKSEMLNVGRQLRDVKAALRRDIDHLDGWLKFFNIAAVPLLIGLGGLGAGLWRRRKNRTDA